MSLISIDGSIRTCKVDVAQAERIESDRFLNPTNMLCPMWGGQNLKGQYVDPDSFRTKTAGCHSAQDRVVVENNLRPDYSAYLNLDTAGIQGDIYGPPSNSASWVNSGYAVDHAGSRKNITGNFGANWTASVIPSCGTASYERGMAQNSMRARTLNSVHAKDHAMTMNRSAGI
jgi:hypothetical protein